MSTAKICSAMATDPDFRELLDEFVFQIPERIRTIREQLEVDNRTNLCTLVHQLRGACGSYGFHDMTPLATNLELALRSERNMDELLTQVEDFLTACSCMTAEPS